METVVESFQDIDRFIHRYVKSQQGFNGQISELNHGKDALMSSIQEISELVLTSAAGTEEIFSLTIEEGNVVELLNKMAQKLMEQLSHVQSEQEKIKVSVEEKSKKKIAMVFDLDDPFWEATKKEAIKTANMLNFDIEFFAPKTRRNGVEEMKAELNQILDQSFDAIVISPLDSPEIKELLLKAAELGIKIIFINSLLEGIPYEALVETNGINIGAAAAKAVKKILNNSGTVIVGRWSDSKMTAIENRVDGCVN